MYDSFSSDYDRFVNWNNRLAFELPFLLEQLQAAGPQDRPTHVLDAACGTGMHAIALAQRGYTTSGADLSAGMIERAKHNAEQAGVRVDFAAAGFGAQRSAFEASAAFPFDALLCLGNSLPHLLSKVELVAALADFRGCLRPGGLLLVQNRNFDAVMRQRERWMEPQSHREGDGEWVFLRFYDYLPNGLIQFNIVTLKRSGQGDWQQQLTTTQLYPLVQAELLDALHEAGFEQVRSFGSMTGANYDPLSSGNLVITARAAVR